MTSIVFTADEQFLRYMPASFAQIARFGRHADGVTLVVPAGLAEEHLANAKAAASVHGLLLTVVPVPERDQEQLTRFKPIRYPRYTSHFTYARLLLPELLPDLDDVLYLDVDTMIRAPIDELLDWDLKHPIGAVAEIAGTAKHLFGTPREPYFNAGVLRMSLHRLRKEQLWAKSMQILSTQTEVRVFDQDVLNIVFRGRFDSIPLTYNVPDMFARQNPRLEVLDDPVIVHFYGPVKAWDPAATSSYARDWRRQYSEAIFATHYSQTRLGEDDPADILSGNRSTSDYQQARRDGRGRLFSLLRAAVPPDARQDVKRAATDVINWAQSQLEEIRVRLHTPPFRKKETPLRGSGIRLGAIKSLDRNRADHGLDLLISIARSGTNALGEVIRQSRPDVRWMNEMYLGAEWTNLADDELLDRFPWFSNGGLDALNELRPSERKMAFESFATRVSGQVCELTSAVLENRSGRTLIKVFPDQLHPYALEKVVRVFRPRLLVLRRELIFTYISQLRASALDRRERQFGKAWQGRDLTDAPYAINDRAALQYALRCDAWFDQLDRLATEFELPNVWLTYTGLFSTGADIPLLESFYPGPGLPTVTDAGGLHSGLKVQDRRSDASVLETIRAVSSLSVATQGHLLRLPGSHPTCT